MIENDGHWLKLMRTALLPTDANIFLRFSGSELVCTVTKDVNKEVELKVTCRIDGLNQEPVKTEIKTEKDTLGEESRDPESSPRESTSPKVMLDCVSERIYDCREDKLSNKSPQVDRESPEVKKMRSEYSGDDSDCDMSDAQNEVSSSTVQGSPSGDEKQEERTSVVQTIESTSRGSNKSSESATSPQSQIYGEEERIYRCLLCNFVSGEQFSFDKHIQTHRSQPGKRASSSVTNSKSFCDACKIQFMSIDTYQVHKQFYCKGRHPEKEDGFPYPSVPESIPANAIKPGPDTVIIRSGINGGMTSSMIQPQAIYAAISTNPLILLPCSLVNGQRLVPHSSVVPTGGPGIVLQTGIACPTIVEKSTVANAKDETPPSRKTSHPIMNFNSTDSSDRSLSGVSLLRKRKTSEGDVLNLKKSCTSETMQVGDTELPEKNSEAAPIESDAPLDLSLKKKFQPVSSKSPPKRKNSVVSVGCPSPSFQNTSDSGSPPRSSILHSRMTMSPNSYSNESIPCYSAPVTVPVPRLSKGMSERLSPIKPIIQSDNVGDKAALRPGMPPPKVLKQGNNICEECHIVFYKYDNYLAHKKHYCAYRRQQLSAIAAAAAAASNQEHSSDDNSEHSLQNETAVGYQSDDPGKSGMSRIEHPAEHFRSVITKSSQSVFCCDACGVKFSTSDNLNAHQTYYCIKRADSAMSKVSAARGENSNSPKGLVSPFTGPEEWKCNYCDATCSSYDAIRRHLMTHSELRGFRCIVCGYKGNTLRGMRSHACEHLTEGTASIEEFVSSNVIAENGIVPIMPPSMEQSDEDSEHSRESRKERVFPERSPVLKKEILSGETSDSNDQASSPRTVESSHIVPNMNSSIKTESGESGSQDTNGSHHPESVNPMAFCDVVIKTENEQSSSGDDLSPEEQSNFIKFEPEPEYDSNDKPSDISKSPPAQVTSVIRRASDAEERLPPKKKGKSHSKTELKYCKSCDISFYHLSNFLAHKKFYCVSRVIQNCHQEAATVQ